MPEIQVTNPNLSEAAARFLGTLPAEEREMAQQEVNRFVRWYGAGRAMVELTAHEIENYAQRLSSSDTDYMKKLELIRGFLAMAKKKGWTKISLATHLKTHKSKNGGKAGGKGLPEIISLTQEGLDELKNELAALKTRRPEVIGEMQRAAADKDFRENAPLAAAREERGHIEGRIKEIEETLKCAVLASEKKQPGRKVAIGGKVFLRDTVSGEEMRYTIVHPKEVDPLKGKISSASPIGKALVGHQEREVVEIAVPAGKICYEIKAVEP